MAVDNPDRAGL